MVAIDRNVGYCLDGGGFRGCYQVGELKAASFVGLPLPAWIQGISVGALNGAAFIQEEGKTELLEYLWREVVEKRGPKFIFRKGGIIDRFRRNLYSNEGLFELLRFLDLGKIVKSEIGLQVVVFNRATRRRKIFTNRDPEIRENPEILGRAIIASCSISGGFPRVFINNIPYSDGEMFFLKSLIDVGCRDLYLFSNDIADHKTLEQEWLLEALFNRAHDSFDINFGDQSEVYHSENIKKVVLLPQGIPTLTTRTFRSGDISRGIALAYDHSLKMLS